MQVHTSVRSAAKAEFLKSLEGASENLTIFSGVDLLESGSYNECIAKCDAVLHTASPFFFEGGTEELLVKPALEGVAEWINGTHILIDCIYYSSLCRNSQCANDMQRVRCEESGSYVFHGSCVCNLWNFTC